MKRLSLILLFWLWTIPAYAADLQTQIDATPAGGTLYLTATTYNGNYYITKPITIIGQEGTKIRSMTKAPAITIEDTNQVTLENITMEAQQRAIIIKKANEVTVTHTKMSNVNAGIFVQQAKDIHIKDNYITGTAAHYAKKGNGIALYQSTDVTIQNNTIQQVQDGIYIENVQRIRIDHNNVTNSRYGTHFMYSEDGEVWHNTYEDNVTGLMVMMVDGFAAGNNTVRRHMQINGSGMTLYDVKNAKVRANTITENRIGLALQMTAQTSIKANQFNMNQTAFEAIKTDRTTTLMANYFQGNILTARSDAKGVLLQRNTYDDYHGIDPNNSGYGETPYYAYSSFGQWMVRQPAYQFFIASPSVTLLTALDQQASGGNVLQDDQPKMMQSSVTVKQINYPQLLIGIAFIVVAIVVWWRNVKR